MYRLDTRYDIVGFKPIDSNDYEASDALDTFEESLGSLTELQYEDFIAVRCRGKSYTERAGERDVHRATIHRMVSIATDKLSEVKV